MTMTRGTAVLTGLMIATGGVVAADAAGESEGGGPVAAFTIQGVRLRMPVSEAEKVLAERGFVRKGSGYSFVEAIEPPADDNPLAALGYVTKSDEPQTTKHLTLEPHSGVVARVVLTQSYGEGIELDPEAIRNQIVAKVGEPDNEIGRPKARWVYFSDAPGSPDQRQVTQACQEAADPSLPAFKTLSLAQAATQASKWAYQGEDEVKRVCPGALETYRAFIDGYLAPKLTLKVGTEHFQSRTVHLELSERGIEDRKQRQALLEREQNKPPDVEATLDF
jgi:hypothetical protein